MQTFLNILLWWIILSCTVGPLLTWLLFYSKREARGARSREASSTARINALEDQPFAT
jgi:hypothetical protein